MDLEGELLKEHSRQNADRIARWVGSDRNRLRLLMDQFLHGEFVTAQRAAWVVGIYAESHPELMRPYVARMLDRIQQEGIHDALKRCVVRMLQWIEIPEPLLGRVANLCFGYLSSGEAPIAVKCFSMTVVARIAEKEPELGRELQLVIEQQIPYSAAGFRARAKDTLNRLRELESRVAPDR
jgi:hypothetical protein